MAQRPRHQLTGALALLLLGGCAGYALGAARNPVQVRSERVEVTRLVEVECEIVVTARAPTSVPPGATNAGSGWAAAGYLWWADGVTIPVPVIDPTHQDSPATEAQLASWVARGEACMAEAGSEFVADDSVDAPFGAFGVEALSGACEGYRGWVAYETMHAGRP